MIAAHHERTVGWFRLFLSAVRQGDVLLRRLAQRELRALGLYVAPVPQSLHERSVAPRAQISALAGSQIPAANEGCLGRETSPPVRVLDGKAAGDDGDDR